MLEEARQYIRAKFAGKPVVKDYINSDGKLPADGVVWPADRVIVDISDPNSLPPGAWLYRNASGRLALKWALGSTGLFNVVEASAAAILAALIAALTHTATTNTPSTATLASKTFTVDSDAAGAVAAATFLAAGGAGVKWIVTEIAAQGYVIATLAAATALLSLSDAPADNATLIAGPTSTRQFGPFKQTNANTIMEVSCGAGNATPLSRFTISVRYWAGA